MFSTLLSSQALQCGESIFFFGVEDGRCCVAVDKSKEIVQKVVAESEEEYPARAVQMGCGVSRLHGRTCIRE